MNMNLHMEFLIKEYNAYLTKVVNLRFFIKEFKKLLQAPNDSDTIKYIRENISNPQIEKVPLRNSNGYVSPIGFETLIAGPNGWLDLIRDVRLFLKVDFKEDRVPYITNVLNFLQELLDINMKMLEQTRNSLDNSEKHELHQQQQEQEELRAKEMSARAKLLRSDHDKALSKYFKALTNLEYLKYYLKELQNLVSSPDQTKLSDLLSKNILFSSITADIKQYPPGYDMKNFSFKRVITEVKQYDTKVEYNPKDAKSVLQAVIKYIVAIEGNLASLYNDYKQKEQLFNDFGKPVQVENKIEVIAENLSQKVDEVRRNSQALQRRASTTEDRKDIEQQAAKETDNLIKDAIVEAKNVIVNNVQDPKLQSALITATRKSLINVKEGHDPEDTARVARRMTLNANVNKVVEDAKTPEEVVRKSMALIETSTNTPIVLDEEIKQAVENVVRESISKINDSQTSIELENAKTQFTNQLTNLIDNAITKEQQIMEQQIMERQLERLNLIKESKKQPINEIDCLNLRDNIQNLFQSKELPDLWNNYKNLKLPSNCSNSGIQSIEDLISSIKDPIKEIGFRMVYSMIFPKKILFAYMTKFRYNILNKQQRSQLKHIYEEFRRKFKLSYKFITWLILLIQSILIRTRVNDFKHPEDDQSQSIRETAGFLLEATVGGIALSLIQFFLISSETPIYSLFTLFYTFVICIATAIKTSKNKNSVLFKWSVFNSLVSLVFLLFATKPIFL